MEKIKFKNIYTTPGYRCKDCIFKYISGCDTDAVEMITGINCSKEGIIFKRKPKRVECTMENTQVDDTVYMGITKYNVDLIYEDGKVVLTKIENQLRHLVIWLNGCQKEVK